MICDENLNHKEYQNLIGTSRYESYFLLFLEALWLAIIGYGLDVSCLDKK
jgi:hypothetical protein